MSDVKFLEKMIKDYNKYYNKELLKLVYVPPKKLDSLLELKEEFYLSYIDQEGKEIPCYSSISFDGVLTLLNGMMLALHLTKQQLSN